MFLGLGTQIAPKQTVKDLYITTEIPERNRRQALVTEQSDSIMTLTHNEGS